MADEDKSVVGVKVKMAESFIERSYGYFLFKDNFATSLRTEAKDYDDREKYVAEVKQCVDYDIAYFTMYETSVPWYRPKLWHFYNQIVEENIEQRFPRDQDIRALMYAYRTLFERNQFINVRKKRIIGLIWVLLLSIPLITVLFFSAELPHQLTFNTGQSTTWSIDTWEIFFVGFGIWALISTLACGFSLIITSNNLRDKLRANAANLGQMIQDRLDRLSKLYREYLAKINDEELAKERGGLNPEWPGRAMWDMQLAVWFSKRIEYVEKALQLEMQRLRLFIIYTNPIGNMTALLTYVIVFVPSTLIYLRFRDELPTQISPIWLAVYCGIALISAFGIWFSTTSNYSITIQNIKQWIVSGNWTTYESLELIDMIGEAIRQSKEDYRLLREQLAGKKV